MKKFNAILAIAAVALTSVFGFTSCDKADEPFDTQTSQSGGNRGIDNLGNDDDTKCYGDKDNNDGTNNNDTTTTVTKTTTFNRNIPSDAKVVNASAKDLAGTYKYTDEEGKEWTIEMTENSCEGENYYCAMITVPEGYGVDAKTYDGKYRLGSSRVSFGSYDKTPGKFGYSIVGFGFQIDLKNSNVSVQLRLAGSESDITAVFVKQ